MTFDLADHPHRRRNLLTGDWVLVSPHRAKRPWQGDATPEPAAHGLRYDPDCYLCPGNVRAGGTRNPDYADTYVFDNDFAAVLTNTPAPPPATGPFETAAASGTARVICFSPDHGATLATMDQTALCAVVDCWCGQSAELGQRHAHVQIFENKGAMMGCSSPHPHGQIWATDFVPSEVAQEDQHQRAWAERHRSNLLDDVVAAEIANRTRVVELSDHWVVIVPHWASWPFETLLICRDAVARLEALSAAQRADLASTLGRLLRRYDSLFGVSFPYSMGWHGAPHGLAQDKAHWRLHAHFYPPLLRSAAVRKFMVGFEMLGEAQRDITPEWAAERLRAVQPS
ncbi:MAG: UDP-glucose--hexose-1-phosphate uridylyltransferase [Sphingomonas sp.]|nr:UDP-glucose--hexose-1-phosphate uridylyltransferase [Sphingomonas sp.]